MRLLTRSDFDGLACGTILKELGIIDCIKLVHPKDIQDGLVDVTDNDVLANVPYAEGCKLWFDHHSSELERLGNDLQYEGASYRAPSAARVIYDYYGGKARLPHLEEMILAVDKVDSGRLTKDEIVDPTGWILLGFIMDPRTSMGRFKEFSVGNYSLIELLIDACRHMSINEILQLPEVTDRIKTYWEQNENYKQMILQHSRLDWEIIITDLRGLDTIYTGNRFMEYSLYPDQNISIWITDGRDKQNCLFAVGYSIINRSATVDVGMLMLHYGGGGHRMVGTCQVPCEEADQVLNELVEKIHATAPPNESEAALDMHEVDSILSEHPTE